MAKLSDLLSDPSKIEALSREAIPQLRGELAQLDTLLLSRLLTIGKGQDIAKDQLLDVTRAASSLGVSPAYLYRHHRDLPFTRRVGRKLLFSSSGIEEYIGSQGSLTLRRHGARLTPVR